MAVQEDIEILKTLVPKTCKMVNGRLVGGCDDWESDAGKAIKKAIESMNEVEQYRALGTVEELKEAREKQVAKKPTHDDGVWSICPCCGEKVANDSYEAVNGELSYCEKCGQALDWEEGGTSE